MSPRIPFDLPRYPCWTWHKLFNLGVLVQFIGYLVSFTLADELKTSFHTPWTHPEENPTGALPMTTEDPVISCCINYNMDLDCVPLCSKNKDDHFHPNITMATCEYKYYHLIEACQKGEKPKPRTDLPRYKIVTERIKTTVSASTSCYNMNPSLLSIVTINVLKLLKV